MYQHRYPKDIPNHFIHTARPTREPIMEGTMYTVIVMHKISKRMQQILRLNLLPNNLESIVTGFQDQVTRPEGSGKLG